MGRRKTEITKNEKKRRFTRFYKHSCPSSSPTSYVKSRRRILLTMDFRASEKSERWSRRRTRWLKPWYPGSIETIAPITLSPTKSAEDLLALLMLQSAILRNTNGSIANTRILSWGENASLVTSLQPKSEFGEPVSYFIRNIISRQYHFSENLDSYLPISRKIKDT